MESNRPFWIAAFLSLSVFLPACDGSVDRGATADEPTSGAGAGNEGGASASSGGATSAEGSGGVPGAGGSSSASGCGGGCLGPGDCYTSSDCGADEYCVADDCTVGVCAPRPSECAPSGEAACGCDGQTYESACHAALAGQSTTLFVAECQPAPEGQFPCGAVFCDGDDEMCLVAPDGAASCSPLPAQCGSSSDCPCLMDATGCLLCGTKGPGAYLDDCPG